MESARGGYASIYWCMLWFYARSYPTATITASINSSMALNFQAIESRIHDELPGGEMYISDILHHVREVVSEHIFRHALRPRGIFQMRLASPEELARKTEPHEQMYMIINFGKEALPAAYLTYLRSYYGQVIDFHCYLQEPVIL